jgi:hypothetical protein
MSHVKIGDMTVEQLVNAFASIGVAQDQALLEGSTAKFNRLFDRMGEVSNELKHRSGDQRRALQALFGHDNMQVRLKAAKHTLAVSPVDARKELEEIAASQWYPQAGDAGMCLAFLDDGTFKPQ